DMAGVLQLVTDKLVELMFDSKTGWAADPQREAAVEANQIQGRQERGWFSSVFGGSEDTKYYTDNQYVLKNRRDIRQNKFILNLSKKSTIKVPLDTAGNLGGLYNAMGQDERYFRVVNLADAAFEFRPVYFQVDGDYIDSFQDALNFVTVNFRKNYPGKAPFTKAITFNRADVEAGKTTQNVAFPRLGMTTEDWTAYEYQVRWSLRGGPTVSVPASQDRWTKGSDAALSLTPPFEKRVVEIEADRSLFGDRGVRAAGLWCFPVARDSLQYVYLPAGARLATDDQGRPQFSFVRYVVNATADSARAATITEAKGGGILTFLVLLDTPQSLIRDAEKALRDRYKKNEIAIRGPIVFQEGRYTLVSSILKSASAGSANAEGG